MKMRLAFAGFRHGHIIDVYRLVAGREDVQVVAACEEDPATRDQLAQGGAVEITHTDYDAMYAGCEFDAVAVGDYFGRRGEVIIRALEAGKHVISDKPVCTRLEHLERIAALVEDRGLAVGCQLPLRDKGNFLALRRLIRDGAVGEVHTIAFSGQHPLLWGSRPGWYFEPGKHGGTINDIGVHGVDQIGWLTGRRIVSVVAARAWNARADGAPLFQDAAQFMLALDNGGGVIADVSYLAPEKTGYNDPQYWRFTIHGSKGAAETSCSADGVALHASAAPAVQRIAPCPDRKGGYFQAFLDEVRGQAGGDGPSTAEVLAAAKTSLLIQKAADEGLRDLPCE